MKTFSLKTNAALNGIKQGCSVLFPFLSFVYCSRILGKEGLGQYSFGQSIVAYFVLLAALGIPNYAILRGAAIRDRKTERKDFVSQVFTISLLSTVIAYAALFVSIATVPKFDEYGLIIVVLSIQILLTTIGADWINTIDEDFLYLTVRYIVVQLISLGCLFVFVRDAGDVLPYCIITMLAGTGGNLWNVYYLRKLGKYPGITKSLHLKEHMGPILVLFASSIAGVVYLNSDITMLGYYMEDGAVGIYTVSSKIYTLVKTMINAVIVVTLPRFSYYVGAGKWKEYQNELRHTVNVIVTLLLPCVTGLFMEADKIIVCVAGSEYADGSSVVKILALALPFTLGAALFSYSVLLPNHREKQFMLATVAASVANILLNFYFLPKWGIDGAAITTLIAELIICVIAMYYARKLVALKVDRSSVLSSLAGCIGIALVCAKMEAVFSNPYISLAAIVAFSAVVYFVVLVVLRNPYAVSVVRSVNKVVFRKNKEEKK